MNRNYFFDGLKSISSFDIESDETSTKCQSDNSLMNSITDFIKPIATPIDFIGYTKNNSSHLSNSVNKEQKLYDYDTLSLISGKRYETPSGFDILECIPSIPSIINTNSTNSITPPSSTLNMIDNHTDLLGISHRLAQNSYITPINSDYDLLSPSRSNSLKPSFETIPISSAVKSIIQAPCLSEIDRGFSTFLPKMITLTDTMELMGYKTNPMESLVPFYSKGNQLLPSFKNSQSNVTSDMWLHHIPDISFARHSIQASCFFEPEAEESIRWAEFHINQILNQYKVTWEQINSYRKGIMSIGSEVSKNVLEQHAEKVIKNRQKAAANKKNERFKEVREFIILRYESKKQEYCQNRKKFCYDLGQEIEQNPELAKHLKSKEGPSRYVYTTIYNHKKNNKT